MSQVSTGELEVTGALATRDRPFVLPFTLAILSLIATAAANAEPFAYVANFNSQNVSVIDTETNTVVATVPVGVNPTVITFTPDIAFAYVTIQGHSAVSVIDTSTNAVVGSVPVGASPEDIAITPDGAFVYVTNFGSDNLSVIDTITNTVTATLNAGVRPRGVDVSPNGAFAYVASFASNTVSVIDPATNNVTATVPAGTGSWKVAVTPDSAYAYVANFSSNDVTVIDTGTNAVIATVQVGNGPWHLDITPDGDFAYVVNSSSNSVSVIDTLTNTVAATVGVGSRPVGVSITPDGAHAYVSNFSSNTVSVIETATNTIIATIAVGTSPAGVAVTPAKGALPEPIAYYPLNGSGAEASGNNVHLSPIGAPAYLPAMSSGLGRAANFDGTDDALIGAGFVPSATGAITLSAWARAETRAVWGSIIKNWNGQFHFGIDGGLAGPPGALSNYINLANVGGQPSVAAPTLFPVGTWVHTAVVINSANQTQRLFINGSLVATATFTDTLRAIPCPGLGIGVKANCQGTDAALNNVPGFWHGQLDEIVVWDVPLSDHQIAEIYNRGLEGTPVLVSNEPPVAEAGESVEAAVGERITLNGLNSIDDSDSASSLTYAWSLVAVPQGSAVSLSSVNSTFTSFTPDLPGEYRVELVVTDTEGAASNPDSVEVLAGIVPAYVFKKVAEGDYSYTRSGSDYSYDYDYPRALASDDKEVMFTRYVSGYESSTHISTYDYSISESDGSVTNRRLARGQSLSPTDTLDYFSEMRRMPDGALKFSGRIKRVDGSLTRFINGIWQLDQNDVVTPLMEFPMPVYGEARTVSFGWGFRFSSDGIAFTTHAQPHTFKEWEWTDNQGVTRTSRYYDQEVYVERDGQVALVWDTFQQIPGLAQSAYWIGVEDVSDAGDVLIRTSYPRINSTGRWDYALIKVGADGSVSTIVETSEAGDFPDYVLGQVEYDGDDILVTLSGTVNGRYEQAIYRDSGAGLERFIAGPYVSASGSFSYSYLSTWGHSGLNGDFLFSGYPSILARIDGRLRRVASRGDQLDSQRPDYLHANAHSGNDLIGTKSVAFDGYDQTLAGFVSSSEYAYAYSAWVFHGKLDTDRDSIPDDVDNCPIRPNLTQIDSDGNGVGDLCEDSDSDGHFDHDDNCPVVANVDQLASDTDPFGDACDSCPFLADDQSDLDGDIIGDACDLDRDGDEVDDVIDNCPLVSNPAPQFDLDADGLGEVCDPDRDSDGIVNEVDGTFDGSAFIDQSGMASNDFTDEHRGGSSFGRLLGSNGVDWLVEDGPDASVGLLISSTAQGRLRACGDNKLITWPGGAAAELTCGSTSVRTLLGLIEVSVDEQIIVSVPQGADARIVDEATAEFAVLVSPLSGAPIEVQLSDAARLKIDTSTTAIIEELNPRQYNITNSAGSDGSISVSLAGATVVYEPGDQGVAVSIDIKPGDGQNSINLGSGGNVPVAIYSSAAFDATAVDPLTISLASAVVQLKGKGTPQIGVEDLNADGLDDLIVHVDTSALELSSEAESAVLVGSTFGGIAVRGSDIVVVVPQ